MCLWQDDVMRRKAHHLMWPGKPYVDDRPPPALPQRGGSLRVPRGIMPFMPSNYNWTVRSPNRPRPGVGTIEQPQVMKPSAKMPAPHAVKVSAPNPGIPGRPVNAAIEPNKPYVRPAGQYAMPAGRPYAAGVKYEPAKPVKDAVNRFGKM